MTKRKVVQSNPKSNCILASWPVLVIATLALVLIGAKCYNTAPAVEVAQPAPIQANSCSVDLNKAFTEGFQAGRDKR